MQDRPPENRAKRGSKRLTRKVRWAAALLLLLYVGSYFLLSRHSLYANQDNGVDGFFYLPCDPETIGRNPTLEATEVLLRGFYYPVWAFDHYFVGGPIWLNVPCLGFEGPSVTPAYVYELNRQMLARKWIRENPTLKNIAHLLDALDRHPSIGAIFSDAVTLRQMGDPARYMIYATLRDICVERISVAESEGWQWLPLDRPIAVRLHALPAEDPVLVHLADFGLTRDKPWHMSYGGITTPSTRKKVVETILKITTESLPNLESRVLPPGARRPTTARSRPATLNAGN